MGPFKTLLTGEKFYLLKPDANLLTIEYIAFVLSGVNRFGGDARPFYSVGQHSINVRRYLEHYYPTDYKLQMAGLLHDAHEVITGDIITPIKQFMYYKYNNKLYSAKYVESKIDSSIEKRFGYKLDLPEVKEADVALGRAECKNLTERSFYEEYHNLKTIRDIPSRCDLFYWKPAKTEMVFINTFKKLERLINGQSS